MYELFIFIVVRSTKKLIYDFRIRKSILKTINPITILNIWRKKRERMFLKNKINWNYYSQWMTHLGWAEPKIKSKYGMRAESPQSIFIKLGFWYAYKFAASSSSGGPESSASAAIICAYCFLKTLVLTEDGSLECLEFPPQDLRSWLSHMVRDLFCFNPLVL